MNLIFVALFGAGLCVFSLMMPRNFFLVYLLGYTRCFGLLPWLELREQGLDITTALDVALVGHVLVALFAGRRPDFGVVKPLLAVVVVIWVIGILLPTLNGYTTLDLAVLEGREFFAFALLPFMILHQDRLPLQFVYKTILVFASVLALIVLLQWSTGFVMPGYFALSGFQFDFTSGTRVRSPLIITIAIFLIVARSTAESPTMVEISVLVLCLLSLLFVEQRVHLISILPMLAMAFLIGRNFSLRFMIIPPLLAGGLIVALFLDFVFLEARLIVPFLELAGQSGAIDARISINEIRWEFFAESPWLGYGFIDEKSRLGLYVASIASYVSSRSLGYGDAGYVDVLLRFGILGAGAFLSAILYVLCQPFLRPARYLAWQRVLSLYSLSWFAASVVLAIFSYRYGIIPVCVLIYLMHYGASAAVPAEQPVTASDALPNDSGTAAVAGDTRQGP